ncbi:hypothetical protein SAMN05216297_102164 [Flavobacterium phragmitis]|uniref:Uncharacterized protein n=1 Tax=Flavobacterium phragmitis TaxID=739143 RepID=A0A1I1M1R0_9FLAO|nr:hypothetical protein SAMN05216297_102164 [Flavobacterium phragmitis]
MGSGSDLKAGYLVIPIFFIEKTGFSLVSPDYFQSQLYCPRSLTGWPFMEEC